MSAVIVSSNFKTSIVLDFIAGKLYYTTFGRPLQRHFCGG